jgi:hypothetical protein
MPGPGGVIFLDLARAATGWAYGVDLSCQPDSGVWLLPGDEYSRGRTYAALDNQLAALIKLVRPSRIGYEAPIPAGNLQGKTTAETMRLQLGCAATVEQTAYRFKLPIDSVASSTVRSVVIGRAYMNEEEKRAGLDVKSALVAPWITSMGWTIRDHNARDSVVGLAYILGHRASRPSRRKAA